MKKLLSMLCVLALSVFLISDLGIAETAPSAEPMDVRITTMKGPTAIGLSHFMDEAEQGTLTDNHYHFEIVASTDEVVPRLAKGEIDLAAIPANLSSVVFNKTEGAIQVLAINTLGVLNILESGDTVHSIQDLRGKTLFATGKNHTPEQVITYLLNENGLKIGEDVTIEWKSEAAECLTALTSAENAIAMLPQPFASAAQMKNDQIRVALDLTEEWDKLQADSATPSTLVTGVVVVRRDFAEAHPEVVSAFLDHYRESVDFVNNNVDEAAQIVEKFDIVKAPVAKKAIPACNIVLIEGAEMQEKLGGYLQVLFDQNPKSVGGQLPDESFYFAR